MPYGSFETADGHILFGGGNDRLFGILCTRLGRPELVSDARFNTNSARVQHRHLLECMIQGETRKKTTQVRMAIYLLVQLTEPLS